MLLLKVFLLRRRNQRGHVSRIILWLHTTGPRVAFWDLGWPLQTASSPCLILQGTFSMALAFSERICKLTNISFSLQEIQFDQFSSAESIIQRSSSRQEWYLNIFISNLACNPSQAVCMLQRSIIQNIDISMLIILSLAGQSSSILKKHMAHGRDRDVPWGPQYANPQYGAPYLDKRFNLFAPEAIKIGTLAAERTVGNWGGDKSKITHLQWMTYPALDMQFHQSAQPSANS